MEELKQFKKQILEAEKYAKVYQESFKRQADNYICSLEQKSSQEAESRERELEAQRAELDQIRQKIKDGKVKELLKDIKNKEEG